MLGLVIFTLVFAVWCAALIRRRTAGKPLPSRTAMLWAMVAVVALGIIVQAVWRH